MVSGNNTTYYYVDQTTSKVAVTTDSSVSWTAKYDPTSKTLTLSNLQFDSGTTGLEDGAIYANGDLNIHLSDGTNNIIINGDLSGTDEVKNFGIKVEGNLIITGSGKLTVKSGNTKSTGKVESNGIFTGGNLTISGSATIHFTAGTASSTSAQASSRGIYCTSSFTLSDHCSVSANGKDILAGKGVNLCSYGIEASKLIISDNARLWATSGYGKKSYGISVTSPISSSGGTITATGGSADDASYGIYTSYYYATDTFNISGSRVTATGGTSTGSSIGIYSYYTLTMNITGGAILSATGNTYGIGINQSSNKQFDINIDNANVTAIGTSSAIFLGSNGTFKATNCTSISAGESATSYGAITSSAALQTALRADASTYKYIETKSATSSESIPGPGEEPTPSADPITPDPVTPTPSRPSRPSTPTISIGGGDSTNAGGTTTYNRANATLTITPTEGYIIKDVLLNGVSQGPVTSLGSVYGNSRVEVIFEKIPEKTPEQIKAERNAKIKDGVQNTKVQITASKALRKGNQITWSKSFGYKMSYFQVWRKAAGGKYKLIAKIKPTSRSYTNTKSLVDDVKYTYKIRGVRILDGKRTFTAYTTPVTLTAK